MELKRVKGFYCRGFDNLGYFSYYCPMCEDKFTIEEGCIHYVKAVPPDWVYLSIETGQDFSVGFVKICGLRSVIDACYCVKYGANAIGVIVGAVHKTEDELTAHDASKIFKKITAPDVYKVMVTHIENADEVLKLAVLSECNTIQLHSCMPVGEMEKVRKSFDGTLIGIAHGNMSNLFERVETLVKSGVVDMILIDTRTADRVGGTGLTHDWRLTAAVRQKYPDTKIILAGGVTPENVEKAIEVVRPFGVDVNSGVKDARGNKDVDKVIKFISYARKRQSAL